MTPRSDRADTIEAPHLLSCICASTRDDEVVIALDGEVDLASAALLHDVLAAAQELATSVVLDASGISFLDSSGIKEIVRANQRGKVRVRDASPVVRRCLTICGLAELLVEAPPEGARGAAFEADVQRTADGTTVHLRGELDADAAPELWRWLDGFEPAGELVVDLAGVTFLDSAGLGCLLKLNRLASDAGGVLIARAPRPEVRRVMETTGLHRTMAILPAGDGR